MKKQSIVGVVMVLVGLTTAVYGSMIMTQTFPNVPATVQVVTANCTTLVPVPSAVAIGSSGGISYGCSAGPAFTVTHDGSSTPTFTFPTGSPYTSVSLIQSATAPTGPCTPSTPVLTSGTAFVFTGSPTNWNYCVAYSNAASSGLPQFTISWSN